MSVIRRPRKKEIRKHQNHMCVKPTIGINVMYTYGKIYSISRTLDIDKNR